MTSVDLKPTLVHPEARIDPHASIRGNGHIWADASVQAEAAIGFECTVGEGVHIGPRVVIGNGCKIQNGAQLFKGVTLEDRVFIGPHVVFTNVLTPRAFIDRKAEFKPTLVKRGASIGANATIICGITIGEYAMIGAGAVVTKNVPSYTLVTGVPAHGVGLVCKCGEKMDELSLRCTVCSKEYEVVEIETPVYLMPRLTYREIDAKVP